MSTLPFLFFTYFVEALIVYFYARDLYKEKTSDLISFGIVLLAYSVLLIIFKFIYSNEIFNVFSIIIVNIVIIYFLYKSSLKSAIFHGFALGICQFLSEFLTAYITAMILNVTTQESVNSYFEVGTISSMIIYFFLTRILSKLSVRENDSRFWGKWFSLSLLPIGSFSVLILFRVITKNISLSPSENTFLIIAVSFLLLVNIIIYMIYEQAEKNNQKLIELELINQKNDIDLQYLTLLEKKNETMNIMAHDYKNNILTIAGMTDLEKIKEYIDNMLGEISKYNQMAKTQNRLLDVILSKYTDICCNKGIKFETNIITDNLNFIGNYDISSLFTNILDNAVEAASNSTEKYINLEISDCLNSYHKILAVNSCDNEPLSERGKLITTKKNKAAHGFGTKSISRIVKKYSGEMDWEYDKEEKKFKLIILFPENITK